MLEGVLCGWWHHPQVVAIRCGHFIYYSPWFCVRVLVGIVFLNVLTMGDLSIVNGHQNSSKPRRIIIVRHGERIDFTFNAQYDNWVTKCFDENGIYRRTNINMPRSLPKRKDGFESYATDSPLTEMGYLQAKITGRALREAGVEIDHVYCSPAYRCVQTCTGILKGMTKQSLRFNVEPSLFEWGAWFKPGLPSWMGPDELVSHGFPINLSHSPLTPSNLVHPDESLEDYYNRSFRTTKKILDHHREHEGCTILLVAHGASLDVCTRQLCGEPPRPKHEFLNILRNTPYLATTMCVEDASGNWNVVEPPILPFQHTGNSSYNWKVNIAR